MALHDTEALVIESATATESLPDPTTVGLRTHRLTNTGGVAAVWSSTGATPFTDASGTNVATISVLAGTATQVQSDGTRWVVKPEPLARRVFAGSGVTDGSGNVSFTFTPAFPAAPIVSHAVQTAITDVTECRVTAIAASSVTFNVRRSPSVVILGISVLQTPVAASGVTVHCHAVIAGQGL
ncbi:hypothetical protein [Streptomyces sp. NPDC059063]|uniref:hypothetical protein n=1 Tax=Streptomyces sp. NPDC059063 TaxID=3346712 RepID=UPI0036BC4A0B